MSWSTSLFCQIEFNKQTYNSISEVYDAIWKQKEIINNCKNYIYSLAIMTQPRELLNIDDDRDPIYVISDLVSDTIQDLKEAYVRLYKLELLKDNWNNCHLPDGKAINKPKELSYDTTYLDGDYIKGNLDETD